MHSAICQDHSSFNVTSLSKSSRLFSGSVAVVLTRADTITVAADSRVSTEGNTHPDTTCKIIADNNIIFAHVGILRSPDSNFDVFSFAHSIIIDSSSISLKLAKFEIPVKDYLWSLLNFREPLDSIAVSEEYCNKHSIHAVFCTLLDSKPYIYIRSFRPRIVRGKLEILVEREDNIGRNNEVFYFGEFGALEHFARSNISFVRTQSDISVVNTLVMSQVLATPATVNAPIDIVRLTRSGIKWFNRKKQCH